MEMIKISAGKPRAIGYDAKTRTLRVQLDDSSDSGIAHSSCALAPVSKLRLAGAFTATISKKKICEAGFS